MRGTAHTTQARNDLAEAFYEMRDEVERYAARRVGIDVGHEVASDVFVAAVRFESGGGALSPGWLMTVARRRVIDHWRREEVADRSLARCYSADRDVQPASEDQWCMSFDVEFVLARLPQRYRQVLRLRYMADLTVGEVADEMGISYRACESLLARARRRFACEWIATDPGEDRSDQLVA